MKRFATVFTIAFCLVVPGVLITQKIALATVAFVTAQSSKATSDRALDAVWELPEVQQKAEEILRVSNGKVRVKLMVESEATRTEPFYIIRVFEEYPDRIVTLYWFRVSSPGEIITVQDDLTGEYISLEQWRGRLGKTGETPVLRDY